MARLLEKLPIIHLWDWADGNKYTIDDDSTVLTPELAESDKQTDEAYDEHYRQQPQKGNNGKSKFKKETKVQKNELNKKTVETKKTEKTTGDKEIVD